MFNRKKKRIEELEVELKEVTRDKERYYDLFSYAKSHYETLTDVNREANKENADLKKQLDWLESELNREIGECQAYQTIANKFMAMHEDGDADDTCIIHNGKVYTILGIKHIVDNLGDTIDIHCELIDPEKAKQIGFKLENKEPKEDKE